MRWLLPLLVALVLSVSAADDPDAVRRRAQDARDRLTRRRCENPAQPRAAASEASATTIWQVATFDPSTRTLSWFDDDPRCN